MGSRDHWIVAAILGFPWLYWVATCGAVYLQVPLPRDPMIFQYTAWAVRQGDVLYRDILDVNGPLITWMHLAFQALGGEAARGLRWLDLAASIAVFATLGAILPSAVTRDGGLGQRIAFAFVSVIVLLSAYFSFNFWDTAQRDGLYFLWILLSVAAQIEGVSRGHPGLLVLSGALSGITWLGKPTFILFSLVQLLPLWLEHKRARPTSWFASSAVLGAVGLGLMSQSIADMGQWLRLMTHDVPLLYRHVHAMTFGALWQGLRGGVAMLALTQAATVAWLVRRRQLPTRALAPGLLAVAAIGNIAIQSKGYFYHYAPLWIGVGVQWVLLIAAARSRARDPHASPHRARLAAIALSVVVSGLVGLNLSVSSYLRLDSLITPGHPAAHDEQLRLSLFSQRDSMLLDERIAADYLAKTTTPDQRVQVFGMDPSLLFLSRRRSATPYIYAFDLVLDDTLNGADLRGVDATDKAAIVANGRARISDFTQRLKQRPPAKLVFPAHADFLPDSPEATFRARLPEAGRWLDTHYTLEATIGTFRVYGLSASPLGR